MFFCHLSNYLLILSIKDVLSKHFKRVDKNSWITNVFKNVLKLRDIQKVASLPAALCTGQGSADRTGRIHKVK